ncbi:MAG: phosphate/phosphite/phosphonate ABC transporter substrate-binding protein [Desulfuromonadia bacterium]
MHRSPLQILVPTLLILLSLTSGCSQEETRRVDLSSRSVVDANHPSTDIGLTIGMGAMITPREGYVYYKALADHLSKRLGMPVRLVDRGNYDEMNRELEQERVDAAFVCAGPYVEGHDRFGLKLLAMPLVNGRPVYHSLIIVHRDSPYRRLDDLRGKRFAFTDPKSNSGTIVPTAMLARMGETPASFFGSTTFTYGHDRSVRGVAEKLVDGAAVDSLIYEYMRRTSPDIVSRTRVIVTSEPYGIPPVVVRRSLPNGLTEQLRQAFLTIHLDPDGKKILKGMMIDRFVEGDERNYDSIRVLSRIIEGSRQ